MDDSERNNSELTEERVLSDPEVEALIMSAVRGHATRGEGCPKEHVEYLARWAVGVRVDAAMLAGILDGTFLVTAIDPDGEDFTLVNNPDHCPNGTDGHGPS